MQEDEGKRPILTGTAPGTIPVRSDYTSHAPYPPPPPSSGSGYTARAPCPPPIQGYAPSMNHSQPGRQLYHKRTSIEAYLLCLLLGFVGAHHFYLRRPGFGVTYIFTLGLLGVGIVVDLFRIPCLVKDANRRAESTEVNNVKRLDDAYVLWMPFGLLGFHHFYLRNHGLGVLYFFTFGLLGIGWLIDLFLMPYHVKRSNEEEPNSKVKSIATAYIFGVSPMGLLGGHHFYLNRPLWGILYLFSFGILGIGWIVDWFRISCLVERTNKKTFEGDDGKRHLDDVYLLWFFPFGFLGFHHFYLHRPGWGILYIFTLGLFGVGWLVDFVRLPCLVAEYNKSLRGEKVIPSSQGVIISTTNNQRQNVDSGNGQYMPHTYGVTGSTYNTTPNQHGALLYPVLNYPGYQSSVMYPPQNQTLHNGGHLNQAYGDSEIDREPPPYTSVVPNAEPGPLPTKTDLK